MNKKIFRVTLNVVDIKTQINLGDERVIVRANRPARVGMRAEKICKENYLRGWKHYIRTEYELTAEQLKNLIEDGVIVPPDIVDVTTAKIEEFANFDDFVERG